MQVGAYLVPNLGTQEALIVTIVGSILGAALLGWVAKVGCDTGLSSAGLMHQVFGSSFARADERVHVGVGEKFSQPLWIATGGVVIVVVDLAIRWHVASPGLVRVLEQSR